MGWKMESTDCEVLIVGAGVTGMSAANRLLASGKYNRNQVVVIEKECEPGGLLRSTVAGQHWWDNGVFFFHHNRNRVNKYHIYSKFPEIFRRSEIRMEKALYQDEIRLFPFTTRELLRSMTIIEWIQFPFSFFYHWVCRNINEPKKDLQTWIYNRITPIIYKHTGLNQYIEKLMGLPINDLSYKFGEDRLSFIDDMSKPSRVLGSNINRILKKETESDGNHENNPFQIYYPNGRGVSMISQKMAGKLIDDGVQLLFNSCLVEMSPTEDRSKPFRIVINTKGEKKELRAKNIISTIPLEVLINSYRYSGSDILKNNVKKLKYSSLYLIFYIVNKKIFEGEHQVLYSLEQNDVWKRLFIRRLSESEYSITVEVPFRMGRELNIEEIKSKIDSHLINRMQFFSIENIIMRSEATVEHAYPVAFKGYDKIIQQLVGKLESESIYTAGRQGRYDYCNVTGAIEWGESSAEKILRLSE